MALLIENQLLTMRLPEYFQLASSFGCLGDMQTYVHINYGTMRASFHDKDWPH